MLRFTEVTGCTIVILGMMGFLSYHIMNKLDRIRAELKAIRRMFKDDE